MNARAAMTTIAHDDADTSGPSGPMAPMADPFRMSAGLRATWTIACMAAIFFHLAGGAYALLHVEPAELQASEDVGGAMAIEFAELPMSIDSQEGDTADSTAADFAPPATDVDEKLSAKTDVDLPTTESSPYEAPPDLQLAEQKTLKQTETPETESQATEEMKVEAQRPPSEAAVDSTAAGSLAALEGDAEVAPSQGSVAQAVQTPASWQRALMAHLGRYKSYPKDARSRNLQGDVKLRIVLDRSGKVMTSQVVQTSGKPAIDAAALDMVARATPLPGLPASVQAAQVEIVVPLRFRLR
jgi:protein TonB